VEEYGPPSLVVNAAEEVVHLSERAGRFLKQRGGEPTHKLLDMAQGELRLELRRLLRTALRTGRPAEALGVAIELDGETRRIDVSARPLRKRASDDVAGSNYALILFDEARSTPAISQPKRRTRGSAPPRAGEIQRLKAELETTKRLLGTMAEEHDTTIEALRATNEELQSISEEQRAVAEELETSKEELQSINEELRTLNQEHRTRNEELAQVNADLLNLIDSTSIGTLFLDRYLCIRRYTPTIAQLFNVMPADRGRPLADLTHRLEYAELLNDARAVLTTLIPTEREIGTADQRWFTMRITPYRSIDDRIDGVVITFTDTTERQRVELEHEELLNTVAEISETKSNFISAMSHEFRTPLNAIIGYADILDVGTAGPVTDVQRVHFDRIKSNARHLNLMVDQILSSARLETQRPTPAPELFDAAALAREVASGIEPLAQTKQLSLKIEVPATPFIVESDPTMLRQILFNLLGNAVRFTDKGSITLRLPPRDELLVLEVEDSGIGIAPENVGLVFERFWQVEKTAERRRGGNGLGLMVSRSLAEALGGTIKVESVLGRGSVFRLFVPKFAR
jgi:two-component system CheB/CheR fusion protein